MLGATHTILQSHEGVSLSCHVPEVCIKNLVVLVDRTT